MQTLMINAESFINSVILLKSTIAPGSNPNKRLKRIHLSFENGRLWGYSCSGFSIMRTFIGMAQSIEDCELTINVPRVMPEKGQKVELEFDDTEAVLSFGDITIKTKQFTEEDKPAKSIRDLYNQLKDPYLDTFNKDTDSDELVNKRINKVYLNPVYLTNIINAIKRVRETRLKVEVENSTTRAIRITAGRNESIEAFLLPVRPSDLDI